MLIHFFNYWTWLQRIRRTYWIFVASMVGLLCLGALLQGHFYQAFVKVGLIEVIKAAMAWAMVEFIFLMAAIIHIGQMSDIELPEDLINYEWEDSDEEEQGNE